MKRKKISLIIILLLIAGGLYIAWTKDAFLVLAKGLFIRQLQKNTGAEEVECTKLSLQAKMLTLKGLTISHPEYKFLAKEVMVEYNLKEILASRGNFLPGLKRITLIEPELHLREKGDFEFFPFWKGLREFSEDLHSLQLIISRGAFKADNIEERNASGIINLEKNNNLVVLTLQMQGIFSFMQEDFSHLINAELQVGKDEILLEGSLGLTSFAPAPLLKIKGKIIQPDAPECDLKIFMENKILQSPGIKLVQPRLEAELKGRMESPRLKGKINLKKAEFHTFSFEDFHLFFEDKGNTLYLKAQALFAQVRADVEGDWIKKEELFQGNLSLFLPDDQREELLVAARAKGKWQKGKLALELEDTKTARNKLQIDLTPRPKMQGISLMVKAELAQLEVANFQINTLFNFQGALNFAPILDLEGSSKITYLKILGDSPSLKIDLSETAFRVKYRREKLTLEPTLVYGKKARGSCTWEKGRLALDLGLFFEPFLSLKGKIKYEKDHLIFSPLSLNSIHLSGSLDLKDWTTLLQISIKEEEMANLIKYASFFLPFKDLNLKEGKISAEVKLSGSLFDPRIEGNLSYKGDFISSLEVGAFTYEKRVLDFRLKLKKIIEEREQDLLEIARGKVVFAQEWSQVSLEGIAGITFGDTMISAPFVFNARILRHENFWEMPATLTIKHMLKVKQFERTFAFHIRQQKGLLEFLAPANRSFYWLEGLAKMDKGDFAIERLAFYEKDKEVLRIKGDIYPDQEIFDLSFNLSTALEDWAYLFPEIKEMGGSLTWAVRLKGRFSYPEWEGEARLTRGRFAFAQMEDKLENVEMALKIKEERIGIQASSRLKNTSMFLEGDLYYRGWQITALNLHLHNDFTRPWELLIPGFFKGEVSLSLNISGSPSSPEIKGRVNLMNSSFTDVPLDLQEEGIFPQAKWDVQIVFRGNNHYYNDFIEAEIKRDGVLSLKWDGIDLVASGFFEVERGSFYYMDTEFTIEKGSSYQAVTTLGVPRKIQGILDVQGINRAGEIKIIIIFRGILDKLQPILSSEPPLEKREILALLKGGAEYALARGEEIDQILRREAVKLTAGGLEFRFTRILQRELRRALRVDVFKIKTAVFANIVSPGSAEAPFLSPFEGSSVTVGKYIAQGLYVDYKTILERERGGLIWAKELGVEYRLGTDTKIRYNYRPQEDFLKTEHEVILEVNMRF